MLCMYPLGSESLGPSLHRNIRLIHLLNRYPLTKLGSWFLIHLIIFPRIYEDDVFSQNCHPACLWCFMIREIDRSPLLSSFPSTSPFPSLLSFSPSLLSFPPFRISSVKLCQFDQFWPCLLLGFLLQLRHSLRIHFRLLLSHIHLWRPSLTLLRRPKRQRQLLACCRGTTQTHLTFSVLLCAFVKTYHMKHLFIC